jgi:hypothetical protein
MFGSMVEKKVTMPHLQAGYLNLVNYLVSFQTSTIRSKMKISFKYLIDFLNLNI